MIGFVLTSDESRKWSEIDKPITKCTNEKKQMRITFATSVRAGSPVVTRSSEAVINVEREREI